MQSQSDKSEQTLGLDTNEWHRQDGSPWPFGVRWVAKEQAFNFAIYSKHATSVELLFFSETEFEQPLKRVDLEPQKHKSGPVWHTRVIASDLAQAKYYAYRIDGPHPSGGFELHHFDSQKLLVDPYVHDVFFPPKFERQAAIAPGENIGKAPLGVLPSKSVQFDWGEDSSIRHGSDLIIYEVHVKGFTEHPSSGVEEDWRGTFLGLIEKIPYLKNLGITAIELMPVFQFDPQEGNYWGYMPLSFFAPHDGYCSRSAGSEQHLEFREMVKEMHVDGFRFDLASIFTRGTDGAICSQEPPIFGQIAADPDLAGIRLIAEPWDMGADQLGRGFPGTQWMQWNSAYQRCMHRFIRGDEAMVPDLMTRIYGSCDLFPDDCLNALRPFQSINYINCHDGFSLFDLVSYNQRRNQANGQKSTDGKNELSWNCGFEGDDGTPSEVRNLRVRQAKNFFVLLMLSAGTPMFRMGDEFLQTQCGNNNPYNQDNETSWINWQRADEYSDFLAFCRNMIGFRKMHTSLCRSVFWHDAIRWYGTEHAPDLSNSSRSIAYCLHGTQDDPYDLYVMINADSEAKTFGVFERTPEEWRRVIDTSLGRPFDIQDYASATICNGNYVKVEARSIVVLQAARDN